MSSDTDQSASDTPSISTLEVGKVSVSPAEYRLIKYDAADVAGVTTRMADVLGIANPIRVLVDETTAHRASTHRFDGAGRRQLKGFADPIALLALKR